MESNRFDLILLDWENSWARRWNRDTALRKNGVTSGSVSQSTA